MLNGCLHKGQIGAGRKFPLDGGHFGPPYQKRQIPGMSLFAVAARSAEGGVTVSRLP